MSCQIDEFLTKTCNKVLISVNVQIGNTNPTWLVLFYKDIVIYSIEFDTISESSRILKIVGVF